MVGGRGFLLFQQQHQFHQLLEPWSIQLLPEFCTVQLQRVIMHPQLTSHCLSSLDHLHRMITPNLYQKIYNLAALAKA